MEIKILSSQESVDSFDLNPTPERARQILSQIDAELVDLPADQEKGMQPSFAIELEPEDVSLTLSREEAEELRDSLETLLRDPKPGRHEHISEQPDFQKELNVWLNLEDV
jgi:hypothetical protein